VDGHAISAQDFLQIARSQDDYYRKLLGGQYEPMKKNLKLGSQAIQGLVDRQLILAEARALGLKTTKEAISKAILENPEFKDPSGNFVGKDRYTDFVGQNFDGGVEAFEHRIAEDLLTKQWIEVMTASARISDAEIEQAWRSRNVRAAADYVFVPSSPGPGDQSVDASTLVAWHASHPDQYRRPETRKVRLIVVERQAQVANTKISDADVKSDYDAHASEFTRPEQRRMRHILLKFPAEASEADKASVREKAKAVLARAQKGEDFAVLARTMSEDTSPPRRGGSRVGSAAAPWPSLSKTPPFATAPGQFAPIVEASYGVHIIQVEEAREAGTTPFEEVKANIRRRLELQKAQVLATAEAQRLAAEVKKPADLDAVAAKAGLKIEERLVPGEDGAIALGASPEFTSAVSSMTPGQVSPPLGVARGLAIVACTEIVPSGVLPLAEVSDRVKADVLAERGRQAALVAARRVAASTSLAEGAKPLKLEVKKSGDLSAGGDLPGVGHIPELDGVLFGATGAIGAKGSLLAPGGAIAYEVTRHDAFDRSKFEAEKTALRDELIRQRRDQLARGLIDNLRQKHTIEINQPLVDGVNG
jgi:peptidyl-prolyl cis-trans isomerase D